LLDEFKRTCLAIDWFFPATPIHKEESSQCSHQKHVRATLLANAIP
jgi:hypothetical protein